MDRFDLEDRIVSSYSYVDLLSDLADTTALTPEEKMEALKGLTLSLKVHLDKLYNIFAALVPLDVFGTDTSDGVVNLDLDDELVVARPSTEKASTGCGGGSCVGCPCK